MLAITVPSFPGSNAPPGVIEARNVFLSQAHASFDSGLRRFFARKGMAPDEVADLTQEVYLRLARQHDVTTIRSAKSFVFVTAANLLTDRFRRKSTRGTPVSLDDGYTDIAVEGADPQSEMECAQQLRLVLSTLRALKPATQHVFLGQRLHGLSYPELAHEFGVSVSMIEKHMMVAIAALRPLRQQHSLR